MKELKEISEKRKAAAVGLVIAVFAAVMVLLYLISPHKIESGFQGIVWRNGSQSEAIPSEVRITGQKQRHRITGELTFTVGSETKVYSVDILFSENGVGYITDTVALFGGEFEQRLIGCIILDKKAERCGILLYEGSGWTSDGGLIFTAPAETREEALNVMRELSRNTEWLSS